MHLSYVGQPEKHNKQKKTRKQYVTSWPLFANFTWNSQKNENKWMGVAAKGWRGFYTIKLDWHIHKCLQRFTLCPIHFHNMQLHMAR